ncbi:hypothetical protein BH24ACT2_BH24ACT2_15430 [soil metagenome]|nr:hypothetical protein [Acidimicrobiia bacterium]MBA3955566.1 hypothetical protein [Acidimicrobiia bacterium]MDQ3462899.1 hypothetical protein [Actinomycetota bacterium]
MNASKTTSNRSSRSEAGTGLIGSIVGVTVFLVLLLFAVHLVLNLYGTSVVTAAAFDAARLRAGGAGAEVSEAEAEQQVLELLDGYRDGGRLQLSWSYPDTDGDGEADVVALRIVAAHPTDLLAGVRFPFQDIDRTISVRMERLR